MAKVGRPKMDEPREMVISLRLTLAEYRYVQALATRRHVAVTDLVRQLLLADMPIDRKSEG